MSVSLSSSPFCSTVSSTPSLSSSRSSSFKIPSLSKSGTQSCSTSSLLLHCEGLSDISTKPVIPSETNKLQIAEQSDNMILSYISNENVPATSGPPT